MIPKEISCLKIIKKYNEIINKEKAIQALEDKIWSLKTTTKNDPTTWPLQSHIQSDIAVAKNTLKIMKEDFNRLMSKFEAEVKAKK